jgi:hypothetical protein
MIFTPQFSGLRCCQFVFLWLVGFPAGGGGRGNERRVLLKEVAPPAGLEPAALSLEN